MYFIGIDGGGTKTLAVLSDETGTVLRVRKFGPGNVVVGGTARTGGLIIEIVQNLLAGASMTEVGAMVVGLAGAGRRSVREALAATLHEAGLPHVHVLSDAELSHFAVFGQSDGILLISGTGSVAFIRHDRTFRQIGGWGYLLGDEGSGFDIGRMAIRAILSDADADRKGTPLAMALLQFYDVASPEELVEQVYAKQNAQNYIAAAAKIVGEQAEANDLQARDILQEAAGKLVSLASNCLTFFPQENEIAVALAGSILENSFVRQSFVHELQKSGRRVVYVEPKYHAAVAGIVLAMQEAGLTAQERLLDKMQKQISQL